MKKGEGKSMRLSACKTRILIPNLPNEVALLCLARVPRQHHQALSEVSYAICSAVSSSEFFDLRSRLGLSEDFLYISLRSPFHVSVVWFALRRQDDDSLVRVPLPPLPVDRLNAYGSASLAGKIYLFGGRVMEHLIDVLSSEVWVLDCRFETWSRGPDMGAKRASSQAMVVGGKIYVVGGRSSAKEPFAEVLDPSDGSWEALPEPPLAGEIRSPPYSVVVQGGLIRVWADLVELSFDVVAGRWVKAVRVAVEEVRDIQQRLVSGGALHGRDPRTGRINRFDEEAKEWKLLEGLKRPLVPKKSWVGPKLVSLGDGSIVAMSGRGAGEMFGREERLPHWSPKTREAEKNTFFEAWFTHIELSGSVSRSEKVLELLPLDYPQGVPILGPGFYLLDWNIFKVSL